MNLSKYEHADRKEAEASKDAPETPQDSGAEQKHHTLFGKQFTEKEQKTLFLYLVIGIVLMELAVTVGAIIISITNAQPSSSGVPHFQFPWIGYLVAVVMVPVLAMLLVNLVSLGFSRGARGGEDVNLEGVPQRMQTFYALVRGAPTVILFAGFVLMCAAIYYLDGVMSLLLKLGENFHLVAIWVVGGFAVAWSAMWSGRGCTTKPSRWKPNTRSATKCWNVPAWSSSIPSTRRPRNCACCPRSPAASQEPCLPPWMWTPQPRFRPPKRVRRIPPKRPWM